MPVFAREPLVRAMGSVLEAAGAPEDIARKVSDWLASANLSGHPSHGMIRIPDYAGRHIDQGMLVPAERPRIAHETDATVLVDGRRGFGHLAAELLTLEVAARARRFGIGAGGVVNVGHIGRLGEWVELAVSRDVCFFMCVGWTAGRDAAPFQGREARLGTNPIAFGAPGDGDSMVFDIATTASAEGKIRHHRDMGQPVPPGWLLDHTGQPTTDPADFYAGGMMLPFGGHKGYGLSLMAAILGGALAGSAAEGVPAGTFAFAVSPDVFGEGASARSTTTSLLAMMRGVVPITEGVPVEVPGDYERKARRSNGDRIELPPETWTRILETARRVGIDASELEGLASGG